MKTTREIAKEVLALLCKGRCIGAFATDMCGRTVSPLDPKATNFCVYGALQNVIHNSSNAINSYTYEQRFLLDYSTFDPSYGLMYRHDRIKSNEAYFAFFNSFIESLPK